MTKLRWLGLLLCLWAGQASAKDNGPIAVLELTGRVKRAELSVMSDQVRAGVLAASRGQGLTVMSRENMAAIARDMGLDLTCLDGECEVDTGRNLNASYVVSGSVVQMSRTWLCTIKVHETRTGMLLSTGTARSDKLVGLVDALPPVAKQLMTEALAGTKTPLLSLKPRREKKPKPVKKPKPEKKPGERDGVSRLRGGVYLGSMAGGRLQWALGDGRMALGLRAEGVWPLTFDLQYWTPAPGGQAAVEFEYRRKPTSRSAWFAGAGGGVYCCGEYQGNFYPVAGPVFGGGWTLGAPRSWRLDLGADFAITQLPVLSGRVAFGRMW